MKEIQLYGIIFLLVLHMTGCQGQTNTGAEPGSRASPHTGPVGGGCDGCGLMYVDMPEDIRSVDTSSAWNEKGQRLRVTGTVFRADGNTTAPGVILYYWQTNHEGYYKPVETQSARSKIHGHIRGWVKSDSLGSYSIYTLRPGPYPGLHAPAHIHFSVKEPGIADEYYIDDIVFEDDHLVTDEYRNNIPNRAGSGISAVKIIDGIQVVTRDIFLGLNIPNYPANKN